MSVRDLYIVSNRIHKNRFIFLSSKEGQKIRKTYVIREYYSKNKYEHELGTVVQPCIKLYNLLFLLTVYVYTASYYII